MTLRLEQIWQCGSRVRNRGPSVYFAAPVLKALLVAVSRAGFEAHMHADGDRAVREGLDGVAALRRELPGRDIRVGIALLWAVALFIPLTA